MDTNFPIQKLERLPTLLEEIPDKPEGLYVRGTFDTTSQNKLLAVVGSRNYTPYGRLACERLIQGLRGYPVTIVSGLALGIDGIAHKAALQASLTTIAVPGSGLSDKVLYPATHRQLAQDILKAGGALLSEFEPDWRPRPESFPKRNRIMAGMSHAVLVIEAETRSGTLITSRLATEYNRDVLAVPGPITSTTSQGPHMLIQKGAALVQKSEDILEALDIPLEIKEQASVDLSKAESLVRDILSKEPLPRDLLIQRLAMSTSEVNILLSSLELKGYIHEQLGLIHWGV